MARRLSGFFFVYLRGVMYRSLKGGLIKLVTLIAKEGGTIMQKQVSYLISVLFIMAAGYILYENYDELATPPSWTAAADQIVEQSWSNDQPGGVVVVYHNGEKVYEHARGLANYETKEVLTTDHVFRLASLTKQFTAATILTLTEEGQLDLDASIDLYVPEFPLKGKTVTTRHLLTHTSGLFSYTNLPNLMDFWDKEHSTQMILDLTKDKDFVTEPGARYSYNNTGYTLLGAIIENLTGKSWHQAIKERLASPHQINSLKAGVEEVNTQMMSRGHSKSEDGYTPEKTFHMSIPNAAGALISTANDMAKWQEALHTGQVLQRRMYQQMISPMTLTDGEVSDYGFGLGISEIQGVRSYEHSGGIPGYATYALYVPEARVNVVVYTNGGLQDWTPSDTARAIAAHAMGQPFEQGEEVAFDQQQQGDYLGVYLNERGRAMALMMVDGQLTLGLGGEQGFKQPLRYIGDGRFETSALTWLEIRPDADGKSALHLHSSGAMEPRIFYKKPEEEKSP